MIGEEPIVFVVDDSPSVRRSLERLIKSVGLKAECFGSAQEYLKRGPHSGPSCMILDMRMPGLSGLELQEALAASSIRIPIIFLTGHANVPESVRAMKAGAVDFIEKPFDDTVLLEAVQKALAEDRGERAKEDELRTIRERMQLLTPREYQVFTLVIRGKLNKQIAYDLGTVEKTIKVHRAQVMKKMQADSVAALVRAAERIGLGTE